MLKHAIASGAQKVMEYFVSINDGIDPFKQQEQEVFTITDLCRQYMRSTLR